MKYLATLAFSLIALAPLAHAQSFNFNSTAPVEYGGYCDNSGSFTCNASEGLTCTNNACGFGTTANPTFTPTSVTPTSGYTTTGQQVVCPASPNIGTGGSCISCPNSCVNGDGCSLSSGTCQALSPAQQSTGNTILGGQTQSTGNTTATNPTVGLINPLNAGTSLPSLLTEILAFVVQIGTVLIVLMVIYVGFKFVMAQGEPGKLQEAREALLWTIVGALILLGAQAIASALQATATAL